MKIMLKATYNVFICVLFVVLLCIITVISGHPVPEYPAVAVIVTHRLPSVSELSLKEQPSLALTPPEPPRVEAPAEPFDTEAPEVQPEPDNEAGSELESPSSSSETAEPTLPVASGFSPVPESDEVTDEYFEKAAFLGDSRTIGLSNYTGIIRYCYAEVGLSVSGVLSNAFIFDPNYSDNVTIIETLKRYPTFYEKIYIGFGVNELGWVPSVFINSYEYVIDEIRRILPDADIYVQSVLPVSQEVSDIGRFGVTNTAIKNINTLLLDMAGRKNAYFVNTYEHFCDENGVLTEGVSGDGVHLNRSASKELMTYIKTHTAPAADA